MWYQLAGGLSVIAGVYLSARTIPLEKNEKKIFLVDKGYDR
jgi:hypothetical protein